MFRKHAVILSLAVLAALHLPAPSAFAQPDPRIIFDRLDRNHDGKLVLDELPTIAHPRFKTLDVNSDGAVTVEEHAAYVERNRDRVPATQIQRRLIETVRVERDIPYAETDHPRQRLDLYLPKEPKSDKSPLIVFIHGGGWRNGDKVGGSRQVLPYIQSGEFAGASIGYRLSGDAAWPAQIHDCKAAIRWLRGNAGKYGVDPDRIAVMGTSAGGHLVAMLGTSGGVAALEGDLGAYDDASSRVQCVVDFYGPANLLTMGDFSSRIDHNAADSPESKLLGGAVQEHPDRAREASPQTYVSADDPPFLILHGSEDPIVPFDQSVQFDKALRNAGAASLLIRIEGGGHGGFRNPEIENRVRTFLEGRLLGRETTTSSEPIPAVAR